MYVMDIIYKYYFYWYLSMQLFSNLFLKKLNAIPNII